MTKLVVTETRNPWNFIMPTLKVSVTKVRGFFYLIECYFQTSFHNSVNKMIHEIRHNNENPFSCSQYDSKFANPVELKMHAKSAPQWKTHSVALNNIDFICHWQNVWNVRSYFRKKCKFRTFCQWPMKSLLVFFYSRIPLWDMVQNIKKQCWRW